MSSSRRISLLDKMEEIAEEQDAEAQLAAELHNDNDDDEEHDYEGEISENDLLSVDEHHVLLMDDQALQEMFQRASLNDQAAMYEYGPPDDQEDENSSDVALLPADDVDYSEVMDTPTPLEDHLRKQPSISQMGYEVDTGGDDDGNNSLQGSLSSDVSGGNCSSNHRHSFAASRQSGSSEADVSFKSAPVLGQGDKDDFDESSLRHQEANRRSTFTVPLSGDQQPQGRSSIRTAATASRRRTNLYRSVRKPGEEDVSSLTSTSGGSPRGSVFGKARFAARRSTRRAASSRSMSTSILGGDSSVAAAVDRLGSVSDNSDWENVAAAAAVVAASSSGGGVSKRGHVQFGADDHVLVLLTLLNVTNHDDDKDTFTIYPVNMYGYSVGAGVSEAEKKGPYSFVLATVTKVHFDEDERYYTVRRYDTASEQRADTGWMEPIRDATGIEAALFSAHRTTRSAAEEATVTEIRRGYFKETVMAISGGVSWPARFARTTLIPFYRNFRAGAKVILTATLHGDSGYGYRISCTSINFLVLCSFIYLFIEPLSLAFMNSDIDFGVAVAEFCVWIILGFELLFELLIRPTDYKELIRSEKAFAPSTARNINAFHLCFESLSLLLFIPRLPCVFWRQCGDDIYLSNVWASVRSVSGTRGTAAVARFCLGLSFLRAFGLFRHWKQMWINRIFERGKTDSYLLRRLLLLERKRRKPLQRLLKRSRRTDDDADETENEDEPSEHMAEDGNEEDQGLKKAATIGTALMVVNSHRALFILLFVSTIFPMIYTIGRENPVAADLTTLLEANNLAANTNTSEDCDYLRNAVFAWLKTATSLTPDSLDFERDDPAGSLFVIWAQLLPSRCPWQQLDGVITVCPEGLLNPPGYCAVWDESRPVDAESATLQYFADELDLRVGGLRQFVSNETAPADFGRNFSGSTEQQFYIKAIFNENHSIYLTQSNMVLLLISLLMLGLVGLTVMRGDSGRLVLDPLQRMLKIVVRYAENPLSQSNGNGDRHGKAGNHEGSRESKEQLGNYETEQLINAIAKIADLLRKCWGVAGAGIISSNLARTKDGKTVVFNPTVPGKRVYALFGFVAINEFSKQLRVLDRDVMILINDVSRVVHDEVFRWSLGGSGQCNKNLGSAFLMVFRIGDFTEVHDKKKRATDVVFKTQMKRNVKVKRRKNSLSRQRRGSSGQFDMGNNGTLQLASLPGIQSFSDRALLGFLKSFAGIHRDNNLQNWKKDFRLGAGVGAFTVSVIYGMDAGWAVEGAVGSEYKIDATYLSPHVNMASRMMSATKQYDVTILLSQAVEELLSKPAREKLRHVDTVTVKGSSVAQRIYTYDARYEGVDFFLLERSPEQADYEAASYNTTIWDVDQDLRAMRQHITDDFIEVFRKGVDQYLAGDWKSATETLHEADDLMIQCILEEGYIDYKLEDIAEDLFDRRKSTDEVTRIRTEFGDGACKCLISYMEKRKCIPPTDWEGVRPLTSK